MIKYISIFVLLICCLHISAQQKINCDILLKRSIDQDSPQQISDNVKHTDCFGLDSIDLKIFGNGPVLGTLLVKFASDHNHVTYADLLSELNKAKTDTGYKTIRSQIITMNTLEATKASPETWGKSKLLLKEIDTPSDEIEKLHEFMLQNQDKNWNYRQLVAMYELKQKSTSIKSD